MLRLGRQDDGNRKGFSLIEMMVASAIFAIAAAVAFILYSAAQKSYKSGENFTNQQQATRVAFDRMISDIRLAGFNTNPDGDTTRVDEQVEGAWDTAITIRGDFDFEDPAASTTPESALAGTAYNVVSTGNDEIITYVLAKSGPTGTTTLSLLVDPDRPRSKADKQVTIPNAVLVQNNPPYTLYRVTLVNPTGAFPSSPQAATNFVFEPVADNIRSMTFQYYDDAGVLLNANTPNDASDDIGGSAANGTLRSRIRRISVNLVGMTEDSDLDWTDPTDATAATQHYRKFDLASDVNPENLGKSGVKDLDITPPPAPTNVSLVPGHCNGGTWSGMLVKWDQPSSTAGVSTYVIKYFPSGTPSSFATTSVPYPHTEWGVIDYLGHGFVTLPSNGNYCFQVMAKDAANNQSGWSPSGSSVCATPAESSTPAAPQNARATGNGTLAALDSQIQVSWDEVKKNAGAVTNDPNTTSGQTTLRDGNGYRLYRDTDSSVDIDATHLVASESVLQQGVLQYADASVANCRDYWYKVLTVDKCGTVSAASGAAYGRAVTTIPPAKPTGVVAQRTNTNTVTVTWPVVTVNTNGVATAVAVYNIYRAETAPPASGPATPPSSGSFVLRGTATPASSSATTVSYVESLTASEKTMLNNGYTFWYAVSATDYCPNESQRSDPASIDCKMTETFTTTPGQPGSGGGTQTMRLSWSGGTDTIVRVRARIPSKTGSGDVYDQTASNSSGLTSPVNLPDWNSSSESGGTYSIYWEVETSRGCVQTWTNSFTAAAVLACQITATNPNITPVNGKPSNLYRRLAWDIQNNAGRRLYIDEIDVRWTNNLGTHKLMNIEYPTGTIVSTFSPAAATPAAAYYIFPGPLDFFDTAQSWCTTCPVVNMNVYFDTAIANGTTSETITVDYYFHDTSGTNGHCSLVIVSGA